MTSETTAVQALLTQWQASKTDEDSRYEAYAGGELLDLWRIMRESRRCAARDGVVYGQRRSQTAIGPLPAESELAAHARARRAGAWWPDIEIPVHSQTVTPPQTVAPGSPVATGQRKPAKPVIGRELMSTVHRVRVRLTPIGWRITDTQESAESLELRWMSSAVCVHPLTPASHRGLTVQPLAVTMASKRTDVYGLYQRLSNGSSKPRQVSPSKDKSHPRWWLDPNSSLTVTINIKVAANLPFDNGVLTVYDDPGSAKAWRLGTQFAAPGPHHPELDGAGWCGGSV